MKNRQKNRLIFIGMLSLIVLAIFVSCVKEPESRISKKLDLILADDLVAIKEGIADSNMLDSCYYDIVFYKSYDGAKFSRKAIVDFYFLRNVNQKIVRKYRYQQDLQMWDRYYNQYHIIEKKSENDTAK